MNFSLKVAKNKKKSVTIFIQLKIKRIQKFKIQQKFQYSTPISTLSIWHDLDISVLLSCLSNYQVQGQLLSLIVDALNPIYEAFSDPNGRFQTPPPAHFQGQFPGIDPGTQFPQATGRDELFPADCGRHTHDGTGKMCFPDGILCQNSKLISWNF